VEILKFISADSRYQTVPVITLSTNSVIDVAEEHVLERANKRLFKASCTPAIMLQAIQELLADPSTRTDASSANQSDGSQPAEPKAGSAFTGIRIKL
jgi:hypothetical protein